MSNPSNNIFYTPHVFQSQSVRARFFLIQTMTYDPSCHNPLHHLFLHSSQFWVSLQAFSIGLYGCLLCYCQLLMRFAVPGYYNHGPVGQGTLPLPWAHFHPAYCWFWLIFSPLRIGHTFFLLFLSLTHGKGQYSDCLMQVLMLVIDLWEAMRALMSSSFTIKSAGTLLAY